MCVYFGSTLCVCVFVCVCVCVCVCVRLCRKNDYATIYEFKKIKEYCMSVMTENHEY